MKIELGNEVADGTTLGDLSYGDTFRFASGDNGGGFSTSSIFMRVNGPDGEEHFTELSDGEEYTADDYLSQPVIKVNAKVVVS